MVPAQPLRVTGRDRELEEGRGDDLWPPLVCGGLTIPGPWQNSWLWRKCLDLDTNSQGSPTGHPQRARRVGGGPLVLCLCLSESAVLAGVLL